MLNTPSCRSRQEEEGNTLKSEALLELESPSHQQMLIHRKLQCLCGKGSNCKTLECLYCTFMFCKIPLNIFKNTNIKRIGDHAPICLFSCVSHSAKTQQRDRVLTKSLQCQEKLS